MATDISLAQASKDKVTGVVARIAMPAPVRDINKLVAYLEQGYGSELVMYQDGDWLVFETKKP
jgi:hypothetical protein